MSTKHMDGKQALDKATELLIFMGTNWDLSLREAELILEVAHDIIEEAINEL